MRPPSPRAFNSPVVFRTRLVTSGGAGTQAGQLSAGTAYLASVQMDEAEATADDRGINGSSGKGVILFRVVPLDTSIGARVAAPPAQRLGPEPNTLDQITWNGRTLTVLGPATDETAQGVVWTVPVEEIR